MVHMYMTNLNFRHYDLCVYSTALLLIELLISQIGLRIA